MSEIKVGVVYEGWYIYLIYGLFLPFICYFLNIVNISDKQISSFFFETTGVYTSVLLMSFCLFIMILRAVLLPNGRNYPLLEKAFIEGGKIGSITSMVLFGAAITFTCYQWVSHRNIDLKILKLSLVITCILALLSMLANIILYKRYPNTKTGIGFLLFFLLSAGILVYIKYYLI